MEGLALLLLITSGVLPWARCSRHSESGVYTLALYFVQVRCKSGLGGAPPFSLLCLSPL